MRTGRVIAALLLCGIALRLIAQSPLRLRTYASGFTTPLAIVQDPSDRAVQYVIEQGGRIRVLRDGIITGTDFLDLRGALVSGGEQGVLGLAFPPDADLQYVIEQGGRIRVLRDGIITGTDFLDLRGAIVSGGEQGLLGLAFPPDASSPRFFVNFTDRSGDTVVARFRRSGNNRLVADPSSRFDLRWSTGLSVVRQ